MVFLKDVSCKKIKSCKKDKDWDKRFKFSLVTTQTKKERSNIRKVFQYIIQEDLHNQVVIKCFAVVQL